MVPCAHPDVSTPPRQVLAEPHLLALDASAASSIMQLSKLSKLQQP